MDRVWGRHVTEIFPVQPAAYGWLGVHLFFLISGFVIGMSCWGRGVGGFLTARAVRLYPAYWVSVLVVAVVLVLLADPLRPVTLGGTVVNLTMFQEAVGTTPVAEVYWTLWAEVRFYLLFSLVVWWGPSYRRIVTFCVVWLAAVTFLKAFVPDGTLPHIVLMSDYAPLFTGGVGLFLIHRFGGSPAAWGIVGVSFLLSVPAARFRAGMEADPGQTVPTWPAVVILAVCFLLVTAVAMGWLSWLRGRWLVVLGAVTYPLYLLHVDLGGPLLRTLQWHVPPAVLVVAVTLLVIGVAWLVHRYVERPVTAAARRSHLLDRKSARP
jgi:peptidoglycan/LPS O-acetylase OafA/YrhL